MRKLTTTLRNAARRLRPGRRALISLVILIALVFAVYGIELLRGRLAWEKYRAQAEARGVKFSLAELLPDSNVPDAENFATVPLINAAVRWRKGLGPYPTDFGLPHDTVLDSSYGKQRTDLRKLRETMVTAGWTADDPTASDAVIALRGLARFDSPLAQLRDGAKRPFARYERDLEHPECSGVPPFLLLRKAFYILHLRFEAHAAGGELDAACEDLELALSLARTLNQNPLLVSAMIKVSVTSPPVNNLSHWLHRAPWTDAHLARFSVALADVDLLAAFARAINVERAYLTHYGTETAAGRLQPYDLLVFSDVVPPNGRVKTPAGLELLQRKTERLASRLYPAGWFLQSVVWSNENVFDPAIARLDIAQHRWNPEGGDPWGAVAALQAGGRFEKLRLALAALAVGDFSRAEARTVTTQAQVDLARTAIALEQHRRTHGAYPAQLADLAPAVLATLPHDLTNGEPLRYRPTADGHFQLYSRGFNRTDEGGSTKLDPTLPDVGEFVLNAQSLDWVWPQPTEPALAATR